MNSNRIFTYILYALLLALIGTAAYKAWQIRQNESLATQEEAEMSQTLRDLGYSEQDSTAGSTAYVGTDEPTTAAAPTVSKSGIEDDDTAGTPPAAATTKPTPAPSVVETPRDDLDADDPTVAGGRYRVVAGSFKQMDGARRHVKYLHKLGFKSAEVGRMNRGAYGVVVVERTDDRREANRIAEKLEAKGVDANVVDSRRQ
jgi:cell division protein FtsN